MTIWKYKLELVAEQKIQVREGANALSVGLDPNGDLCVWVELKPGNPPATIKIQIVGTGDESNKTSFPNFIGTVVQGRYVWHVYHE